MARTLARASPRVHCPLPHRHGERLRLGREETVELVDDEVLSDNESRRSVSYIGLRRDSRVPRPTTIDKIEVDAVHYYPKG